jgi:DNA-directed RNA polymerase subunit L
MTPENLRVLIEAGENLEVEFKGEEHGFMGTLFTSLIKSPIF